MDSLLRRCVKRQEQSAASCGEFDPEIASLYVERVLTEREVARFENHLSACSPCRQGVVLLTRLAQADVAVIDTTKVEEAAAATVVAAAKVEDRVVETQPGLFDRLKALLLPLGTPRFALAAVALMVLAVSVPLFLADKNQPGASNHTAQAPDAQTPANGTPVNPTPGSSIGGGVKTSEPAPQNDTTVARAGKPATGTEAEPTGAVGGASGGEKEVVSESVAPAPGRAGAPVPEASATASTQIAEAKDQDKKKEDSAAKSATADEQKRVADVAAAPPSPSQTAANDQRANEQRRLEKIDPREARSLPESDRNAPAVTIKPGANPDMTVGSNREKPRVVRPKDDVAPPPAPSAERRDNRAVSGVGRAYRERGDSRERASTSRKVRKKTFFLINDTWTDKDYRKEKEMPVVTLVKDSDVYKEVVAKHSELQKLFSEFAAGERAVVVYKNTVYKLIPQDSDR